MERSSLRFRLLVFVHDLSPSLPPSKRDSIQIHHIKHPSWSEHLTSRYMYKRATKKLAEAETLLVAFTEFEERFKESERARFIYKFGLDHIPTWRAEDLYKKFVAFEKQYGDKEETEDATAGKRRFQYEDEVRKNTLNYDSWFDYVTLIILRIRRLIWVWCG
ncbi:unnamed protein product [Brassica rapa subsp. narinosa]|uniref:(rape) hypothetical protein n=1 Tax=Brassica napus TaxID=3708 RepID=A0A816P3Z7_BRANA|nr:unnamed protein product [Brassica napus]